MSSGLQVDFAQAKLGLAELETVQVGAQSTLEPGVDSARSQGGPFIRGKELQASHQEAAFTCTTGISEDSDCISEGDGVKTLEHSKVAAEDVGVGKSNKKTPSQEDEDYEEEDWDLFLASMKAEIPTNPVNGECDQEVGEAPSPSPPRATGPLRCSHPWDGHLG
jgi:hypothetical protein